MTQDDPQDAATEAFEALRAEVTQLRAGVEGLSAKFQGQDPTDYAPTLGAIALSLEAIEGHPALQADPETYARQFRAATELSTQQGRQALVSAVLSVTTAGDELKSLVKGSREGREQTRVVITVAAIAAGAGAILWACLSGPIARVLPAGWNLPERMAARTLKLDPWDAGMKMMSTAAPERWARVVAGDKLAIEKNKMLNECRAAAANRWKAEGCTVSLKVVRQR